MLWLDHSTGNVDYTFHCNSLGNYSLIDHFLCSPELVAGAQSVTINNDGDNLSDHLCILCSLNVPKSLGTIKNNRSCVWKSQWDKADIEWYKSVVTDYLDSIALPTEALHCNAVNCHCHTEQIEQYYSDIVGCLKLAERLCVPRYKVGFHKHWWSPKLDDMKQRCIDITNLWTSVGIDHGVASLILNVFSVNTVISRLLKKQLMMKAKT